MSVSFYFIAYSVQFIRVSILEYANSRHYKHLGAWHSAGVATLGLNCAACWEPLVGVSASGDAFYRSAIFMYTIFVEYKILQQNRYSSQHCLQRTECRLRWVTVHCSTPILIKICRRTHTMQIPASIVFARLPKKDFEIKFRMINFVEAS